MKRTPLCSTYLHTHTHSPFIVFDSPKSSLVQKFISTLRLGTCFIDSFIKQIAANHLGLFFVKFQWSFSSKFDESIKLWISVDGVLGIRTWTICACRVIVRNIGLTTKASFLFTSIVCFLHRQICTTD